MREKQKHSSLGRRVKEPTTTTTTKRGETKLVVISGVYILVVERFPRERESIQKNIPNMITL